MVTSHAGQVDQRQRSHRVTGAGAQRVVDLLDARDLFVQSGTTIS